MTYEHKVINEKRSFTEYTVSSPTQSFAIGFELYEDEQNIHLTLDNIPIADLGYTFVVINSLTVEITPAISSGVLRIQRETDIDENKHKFSAGAIFNALSMDENFEQIRQSQQETRDGFGNLVNRVVPLVDGLEEALDQAAAASQAAQDAATAAEEAANTTRSHTTLTDRSLADAHPAIAITLANSRTVESKIMDSVCVDDYYTIGGALRPVSDLYTVGSGVYNPIFTDLASVQAVFPHVTSATDPLDWAATQQAVNTNNNVVFNSKFYYFGDKTLEIPTSCTSLLGKGDLTRIYTNAAIGIKVKPSFRLVHGVYGGFYLLGSNVANSIGFDASAMSYCTIRDMYIRQFDTGWFADGSTTPVNKQYSNNVVINVRSNNNVTNGFKFVGSSESNSANIYIGCEGAGNKYNWYEDVGYCNQMVGCTLQGGTIADMYLQGTRNDYMFYAEGNPKSVKLTAKAAYNRINVRSSYPLWNTFDDLGVLNDLSVRGSSATEVQVFSNPYSERWTGTNPDNILPNGTPVFSYFTDPNIKLGGGLRVTFNANFQGIIVQGFDPLINYAGKWVTIQIEADTSGITDLNGLRIYTRGGTTSNSATGEFAVASWKATTAGNYTRHTFDVKFANSLAGTPNIIIYLAYSGITTTNNVNIQAIKVALGQCNSIGDYALSRPPRSAVSTAFTSATSGLNVANKYAGKVIQNSTTGAVLYATGNTPTSQWKSFDGVTVITPA